MIDRQQDEDLIQAHHDTVSASASTPLSAPIAGAADAPHATSHLLVTTSDPVAAKATPASSGIVQHSLQEAAALYMQPMGKSPYAGRSPNKAAASNVSSRVKQAIAKNTTFAGALKAVGKQATPEAASQLLQHYLFSKKTVTVTELDSTVAAVAGQSAQSQAAYAASLIAQQYYFAAMKATFTHPQVLSRVLQDVQQQVSVVSDLNAMESSLNYCGVHSVLMIYGHTLTGTAFSSSCLYTLTLHHHLNKQIKHSSQGSLSHSIIVLWCAELR